MSELKTKPSAASVQKFVSGIKDAQTRTDAQALVQMMGRAARAEPRMWGSSIVGFGEYHYVYDTGREGDWFVLGFSPRKGNLTLYFMSGLESHATLMKTLGRFTTGKSCLYIKRLEDLHLPTLRKLMAESVKAVRERERGDLRKKHGTGSSGATTKEGV